MRCVRTVGGEKLVHADRAPGLTNFNQIGVLPHIHGGRTVAAIAPLRSARPVCRLEKGGEVLKK